MRISQRKKAVTAAMAIGIITIIFILFSSGHTKKVAPNTEKLREYNYDVIPVLRRFGNLAREKKLMVCVIEPHILFSMISKKKQQRLSQRSSFNFSAGNKNVVTVAVEGKHAWKFYQNKIKTDFESAGFSHFGIWKSQELSFPDNPTKSNLSTHYFYVRHGIVIHVVIFYQRDRYFWHGKLKHLPMEVDRELLKKDLFFTESDSVYERFHAVPMDANESNQGLYVPEDIEHFLFEIPTSQFVDCHSHRSRSIRGSQNISYDLVAPEEVFMKTADYVIVEMKKAMSAHMIPFWLASGTLLGWYRNCGIIPYTSDMDFATWSSDLNSILEKEFKENVQLRLLSTLGQGDEDLEFWLVYKWLRVDLFFTYQNDEQFWVGGHNTGEGYSFRYLFPKFDLCSGDFLGHKVLVPCQVEEVLQAEYGSGWMTPLVSWNYEASARNVMGRRYWSKQEAFRFINQISAFH